MFTTDVCIRKPCKKYWPKWSRLHFVDKGKVLGKECAMAAAFIERASGQAFVARGVRGPTQASNTYKHSMTPACMGAEELECGIIETLGADRAGNLDHRHRAGRVRIEK